MAYKIGTKDGEVQDALRRIADEQIGRALAELAEDGTDFAGMVHQVRKRCKKLRGLLRLVRPAFDAYATENASFRDAARRISGIRDARTLIETYDAVAEHFAEAIDRRAFAPIRARLTRDAAAVRDDPDTIDRLAVFRTEMEAARGRAAGWRLEADGFDAVSGGLGRTYARARSRMQDAWAAPDVAAMHEWRKRVKYHWYHARLLREIHPDMMAPHVAAMDELSELLGDHHDLAVLDARLAEGAGEFGPKTDVAAFRALVGQRMEALEDAAFSRGRLVLAERKKALVKRWGAYW
ncbi:MAG: CHAD domain-containing protein [Roseicyclus sp.]